MLTWRRINGLSRMMFPADAGSRRCRAGVAGLRRLLQVMSGGGQVEYRGLYPSADADHCKADRRRREPGFWRQGIQHGESQARSESEVAVGPHCLAVGAL